MFLHLSVILFTGGCAREVCVQEGGYPGVRWVQGGDGSRGGGVSRVCKEGASPDIRSTGGWYISYWNAFLFYYAIVGTEYNYTVVVFCTETIRRNRVSNGLERKLKKHSVAQVATKIIISFIFISFFRIGLFLKIDKH